MRKNLNVCWGLSSIFPNFTTGTNPMRKRLLVCNIIVAATLSVFCAHKAIQIYGLYCHRMGASAEELLALTKRLDAICSTCMETDFLSMVLREFNGEKTSEMTREAAALLPEPHRGVAEMVFANACDGAADPATIQSVSLYHLEPVLDYQGELRAGRDGNGTVRHCTLTYSWRTK